MTPKEINEKLLDVHSYVLEGDIFLYHKYVSPMFEGERIIDLGTGYGKSAMAMALSNPDVQIISIDDGSMPLSNNYVENISSYRETLEISFNDHGVDNIQVLVGDILEIADRFPEESFDLLHIDMMIQFDVEALEKWLPKLRIGGILLLRNYERKREEFDKILAKFPTINFLETISGSIIYVYQV